MESTDIIAPNHESWRSAARCSEMDTTMFFPIGVTGSAEMQIQTAKAICTSCPVEDKCLEYAINTNQEYGIWGGKDEEERRIIRRIRRREKKLANAS